MKKLLSTVLIVCLALSAIACNNTKNEESTDTTDFTTRETETQITPDFSEPNQSIASSVATTETESSETATPTQSGAYTYEAYGYSFAMDINIDDYIYVSEYTGNTCFNLYSLAEDIGITNNNNDVYSIFENIAQSFKDQGYSKSEALSRCIVGVVNAFDKTY